MIDNAPRIQFDDMLYSLKSLMWRNVGLKRNAAGLRQAEQRIGLWHHYLMRATPTDRTGFQLANMLTVSALVARSAYERTESRGTHFRMDHPSPTTTTTGAAASTFTAPRTARSRPRWAPRSRRPNRRCPITQA